MILTHLGKTPQIHASAYLAPTATLCGDIVIGPNSRVMFGASVIAEGGRIVIGENCIVMENAVVRSTGRHSATIGNFCLIGPNAHVVGCTIEDQVFIATGAAVFHGAHLAQGCEVRVHGVVHIKTHVAPGITVPIGWIAVGDPAKILPPESHDEIWQIQKPLNFPMTAYGIDRDAADMRKITQRVADTLATHKDDSIVS